MRTHTQQRIIGTSDEANHHARQQSRTSEELQGFDSGSARIRRTTRGFRVELIPPPKPRNYNGYQGEYNPELPYFAGMTFNISTTTVIAGITVIAGLYGVPPAGTDVNGLPWAGYVPANPGTNGGDTNAVPQSPLPALGASPNDTFYADLVIPYC